MGLFDGFKGGEAAAPMGIRNAIKEELDRNDWNYEINDEKEENRQETYFYMRNELENDEPITAVIVVREYDHADGFIKIKLYDIAYLERAEARAELLAKINTWNGEFRYVKFCLDRDQDVVLDIDLPLDLHKGEFQPDSVMAMMAVGMRVVEKVYDDLTELCTRGHKASSEE
ncbi:histidine kinase [Selenomonas sp. oral taxon 920]|uniref:YbjN domain-containing protein n=1 Tax=Selenomonas sp. oral taxon 920 TaxID=1884263 RepID=UPI000840BCA0|nr:YbjN domain-containing protein [Selenomonas sp. oral taxon 920]AOH48640.1 histidine kinase [Selenomonas sp. oral taxon 920]